MRNFLLWCILLVLCWPLALIVLFFLPIIWLISIPFRILGGILERVISFLKALLMLPFRIFRTT